MTTKSVYDRGWVRLGDEVDADARAWLRENLTYGYTISGAAGTKTAAEEQMFREADGQMWIPRGAIHAVEGLRPGSGDVALHPQQWLATKPIVLRDYQVEPVEKIVAYLKKWGGGILSAQGGRGKTVMALEIARRLGQPTLVLVHSEMLMDQWILRISKGDPEQGIPAFLPWAKVGTIRGPKADSGTDYDFVVGMAQTIARRDFPSELRRSFGLVITDEVHVYGCDMWRNAITEFDARYRLGLSATPDRRDGRVYVFVNHIGPVAVTLDASSMRAKVYVQKRSTKYETKTVQAYGKGGPMFSLAKFINVLTEDEDRNAAIIKVVTDGYAHGRRTFVLTDRVEHAKRLLELASTTIPVEEMLVYTGKTKTKDSHLRAKTAKLILATYQYAATALDLPTMDTLILATPKKDVRQALWRVARDSEGKRQPVVVDIVDTAPTKLGTAMISGMANARLRIYKQLEYEVRNM
jgi:superfamily II DNA or RNA helicase